MFVCQAYYVSRAHNCSSKSSQSTAIDDRDLRPIRHILASAIASCTPRTAATRLLYRWRAAHERTSRPRTVIARGTHAAASA